MISESYYWKRPLLKMARSLRSLKDKAEISERDRVTIEKHIFIGFYTIRKLVDSLHKITDSAKSQKIKVEWHSNTETINWLNKHKIDEIYNLHKSMTEYRDIRFICGQIIHSYIFMPTVKDSGGLDGMFFASDTGKDTKLYYMDIDEVIRIFELIGNDKVREITSSVDPKTEVWITRVL